MWVQVPPEVPTLCLHRIMVSPSDSQSEDVSSILSGDNFILSELTANH